MCERESPSTNEAPPPGTGYGDITSSVRTVDAHTDIVNPCRACVVANIIGHALHGQRGQSVFSCIVHLLKFLHFCETTRRHGSG